MKDGPAGFRQRSVTLRAVGLGAAGALAMAVIAPVNDHVLGNGFIVGSYLPVGLIVPLLLFVLLINGALHRWWPARAFSRGELGVMLGLGLMACTVLSQGAIRVLIPVLVSPPQLAEHHVEFATLLRDMQLPGGLFPSGDGDPTVYDAVSREFYGRTLPDEPTPLSAWPLPVLRWMPLLFGMLLMLAGVGIVLRRQWQFNERVPFPLAQVQTMLIDDPSPGQALNTTMRSRMMWFTALTVLVIQSTQPASLYLPQIPVIPTSSSLGPLLTDSPLRFLPEHVKQISLVTSLIGLAYFVHTRVTLSMFTFVAAFALLHVVGQEQGSIVPGDAGMFQGIGAALVLVIVVLVRARRWLGRVIAAAVGRPIDPGDRVELHAEAWAARAVLLGMMVVVAWFLSVGISWWLALLLTLATLFIHTVTARVVAETGLPFFRVQADITPLATLLPATAYTPRDGFFIGATQFVGSLPSRLSATTFAQHAAIVADTDAMARPQRRRLTGAAAGLMLVTFVVGLTAALYVGYRYDGLLATDAAGEPADVVAQHDWPAQHLMHLPTQIERGEFARRPYNAHAHVITGAVIMAGLMLLTIHLAWWPLAPVGFLVCHSWYIQVAWASLLLGCVIKMLVVRLGGSSLLVRLRPMFVGLIIGEALTIGLWLVVSLALAGADLPFYRVMLSPR